MRGKSLAEVSRYDIGDDTWCLLIAVSQIVGGAAGLVICLLSLGAQPPSLLVALLMTPFAWGIYAGVMLWKGKRSGLVHSIFLQAIQIPMVATSWLTFYVFLGIRLMLAWGETIPLVNFHLGAGAELYMLIDRGAPAIGVNFTALAGFLYLLKARRRLDMDKIDMSPPQTETEVSE